MMRIVVGGTGTEVGKTHVTRSLAGLVRARGLGCAALKPIESGGDGDGRILARAAGFHVKHPPPYQFEQAVSPHLAARNAGELISVQECVQWVGEASLSAGVVLVELAGGILSPLAPGLTNMDLLRALAPSGWILVAPDRLGVLHDLRAACLAVSCLNLPPPKIVLNSPADPDTSTGTNAHECSVLGLCRVSTTFPRCGVEDEATAVRALQLAGCLNLFHAF